MTTLNITPAGIAAAQAGSALINNILNGTEYKGTIYTADQINAMREWVADCAGSWSEDDFNVNDYSDLQIIIGVARHYDGGLTSFINSL